MKIYSAMAILSLVLACAAYAVSGNSNSGALEIAGSSTILPLAESVGKLYHEKYKGPVRTRGGGSLAGMENVLSGKADIGLVSRALKDSEKAGLDYITIGHDAIVVVVNDLNPVREIRRDQLIALYSGKLLNWKELGGRDEPVLLISKLPGRSALEIFEEYTGLRHPSRAEKDADGTISKSVYEIGSNLESATLVGGLPGAVGYLSMGTALSLIEKGMPLKILGLEGIEGTIENVINGRYPLRRDLNLVFKRGNRKVKRFIGLFLGLEGQRVVKRQSFIPAKEEIRLEAVGKK